jgi:murein DD-endopeptidase MepM/ murein hydrolase activator NlpD
VVKDGDVLERIARRHGVKLAALLSANGLESESLILPGRKLTIPSGGSGAAPAATSSPTTTAPAASSGSGWVGPRMVCPVPGASYMNDWGFPRGTERFHEGTDLFASEGTTIVAPVSGTLTFGSNGLGGTTFNITTPDGWVIYGAHLSKAIGSSRQVSAGTAVGLVGDTGGAEGGPPHLHLGIKPAGGRPANPYPSVLAACG